VRLALWGLVALVGGLALSGPAERIDLPGWLPALAVAVLAALAAAVLPELWWRRWRYEVREDEIDLRHGTLTVRRTLVPIRRVQHVDTESSALQSAYDLASVTFHTAAGGTEIPAVPRDEAERVRSRVAALARTRDDV
jgi:hypothetical protein